MDGDVIDAVRFSWMSWLDLGVFMFLFSFSLFSTVTCLVVVYWCWLVMVEGEWAETRLKSFRFVILGDKT